MREYLYLTLKQVIDDQKDSELDKLLLEYLPLTFSRRHGDPSRPWNRFSIDIKDDKNEEIAELSGELA